MSESCVTFKSKLILFQGSQDFIINKGKEGGSNAINTCYKSLSLIDLRLKFELELKQCQARELRA